MSGWNVFAYLAVVNASYLIPEFIIDVSIIRLLLRTKLLRIYM